MQDTRNTKLSASIQFEFMHFLVLTGCRPIQVSIEKLSSVFFSFQHSFTRCSFAFFPHSHNLMFWMEAPMLHDFKRIRIIKLIVFPLSDYTHYLYYDRTGNIQRIYGKQTNNLLQMKLSSFLFTSRVIFSPYPIVRVHPFYFLSAMCNSRNLQAKIEFRFTFNGIKRKSKQSNNKIASQSLTKLNGVQLNGWRRDRETERQRERER